MNIALLIAGGSGNRMGQDIPTESVQQFLRQRYKAVCLRQG